MISSLSWMSTALFTVVKIEICEAVGKCKISGYLGDHRSTSRETHPTHRNNKKRSHTQLDSRKQVIAFQDRVISSLSWMWTALFTVVKIQICEAIGKCKIVGYLVDHRSTSRETHPTHRNNKKRSHTQLDSRKQVIAFQDRVISSLSWMSTALFTVVKIEIFEAIGKCKISGYLGDHRSTSRETHPTHRDNKKRSHTQLDSRKQVIAFQDRVISSLSWMSTALFTVVKIEICEAVGKCKISGYLGDHRSTSRETHPTHRNNKTRSHTQLDCRKQVIAFQDRVISSLSWMSTALFTVVKIEICEAVGKCKISGYLGDHRSTCRETHRTHRNNKKRSHTQLDSRKQVIAFQDRVISSLSWMSTALFTVVKIEIFEAIGKCKISGYLGDHRSTSRETHPTHRDNKKRSHTQLDSRKQVIAFQDRVISSLSWMSTALFTVVKIEICEAVGKCKISGYLGDHRSTCRETHRTHRNNKKRSHTQLDSTKQVIAFQDRVISSLSWMSTALFTVVKIEICEAIGKCKISGYLGDRRSTSRETHPTHRNNKKRSHTQLDSTKQVIAFQDLVISSLSWMSTALFTVVKIEICEAVGKCKISGYLGDHRSTSRETHPTHRNNKKDDLILNSTPENRL